MGGGFAPLFFFDFKIFEAYITKVIRYNMRYIWRITMEYKQAAEQNLKVWARRMGVPAEKLPAMTTSLHKNFPGSVLKGPLAIVLSAHLMGQIPVVKERKPVVMAMAEVLANHLRGKYTDDFKLELAIVWPSREMIPYLPLMLDTINHAISQRQDEHARPNMANIVINRARGRG